MPICCADFEKDAFLFARDMIYLEKARTVKIARGRHGLSAPLL